MIRNVRNSAQTMLSWPLVMVQTPNRETITSLKTAGAQTGVKMDIFASLATKTTFVESPVGQAIPLYNFPYMSWKTTPKFIRILSLFSLKNFSEKMVDFWWAVVFYLQCACFNINSLPRRCLFDFRVISFKLNWSIKTPLNLISRHQFVLRNNIE